eukprot:5957796-Lingulodinium_polyedra.AAC.1
MELVVFSVSRPFSSIGAKRHDPECFPWPPPCFGCVRASRAGAFLWESSGAQAVHKRDSHVNQGSVAR